ncbi:MAG: hypothetical protein ACRDBM_11655 [Sporomusa sp.]
MDLRRCQAQHAVLQDTGIAMLPNDTIIIDAHDQTNVDGILPLETAVLFLTC